MRKEGEHTTRTEAGAIAVTVAVAVANEHMTTEGGRSRMATGAVPTHLREDMLFRAFRFLQFAKVVIVSQLRLISDADMCTSPIPYSERTRIRY